MHHPTDRIIRTKAFVTPVVENWLEQETFCMKEVECSSVVECLPTVWYGDGSNLSMG